MRNITKTISRKTCWNSSYKQSGCRYARLLKKNFLKDVSIFRIYQSLCPMDYHLFTFVTIARRSLEQLLLKPLCHIGTSKLTFELSKRFLTVLVFHYPPLSTPNLYFLPSARLFFLLLKLCHIFFFFIFTSAAESIFNKGALLWWSKWPLKLNKEWIHHLQANIFKNTRKYF